MNERFEKFVVKYCERDEDLIRPRFGFHDRGLLKRMYYKISEFYEYVRGDVDELARQG